MQSIQIRDSTYQQRVFDLAIDEGGTIIIVAKINRLKVTIPFSDVITAAKQLNPDLTVKIS